MAKRARELAVKEKRDRKRAKKAEAAAQRNAPDDAVRGDDAESTEGQAGLGIDAGDDPDKTPVSD